MLINSWSLKPSPRCTGKILELCQLEAERRILGTSLVKCVMYKKKPQISVLITHFGHLWSPTRGTLNLKFLSWWRVRMKSRTEERWRKEGLRKPFSVLIRSGQEEWEKKSCAPNELEKKRFNHCEWGDTTGPPIMGGWETKKQVKSKRTWIQEGFCERRSKGSWRRGGGDKWEGNRTFSWQSANPSYVLTEEIAFPWRTCHILRRLTAFH